MSPTAEEKHLLQSIVVSPDNDAPRLAYADWLDLHHRHARAQLIRVQCRKAELEAEEAILLDRYGTEWTQDLQGLGVEGWKFHRGFPEEIRIPARHFFDSLTQINEITPVSHLTLNYATNGDLDKLAHFPGASQLRSLALGTSAAPPGFPTYDTEGVRILARSEHLRKLRDLTLGITGASQTELTALGEADLPNLKRLTFTQPGTGLDRSALESVASSISLAQLEELEWGSDRYGPKVLDSLRKRSTVDRGAFPDR